MRKPTATPSPVPEIHHHYEAPTHNSQSLDIARALAGAVQSNAEAIRANALALSAICEVISLKDAMTIESSAVTAKTGACVNINKATTFRTNYDKREES